MYIEAVEGLRKEEQKELGRLWGGGGAKKDGGEKGGKRGVSSVRSNIRET